MRHRATIAAALLAAALPAMPGAQRKIAFTTSEGTWMNVDVSPDGRSIVFDLLGDLYVLPMEGGTARRISEGRAYDTQPRWSPDGRSLAFSSDRSGADNIWVADADGSNPRALTRDRDGGLTAPEWSPDGEYIVARKDPTYNRRGSAELWLYHRDGGAGLAVTRRTAEGGLNPNGAVFSPDGRWIYFSHGVRVLDSTWGAWQVWRLDRQSGALATVTAGYRGAVRPAIAPDGRWLAYVRRDHARSALVLRDLQTGAERDLKTDLDRDDQRGTTDYDAYPGFSFTPDGKHVVVGSGGKIQRIALDGTATAIPFSADVAFDLPERPAFRHRIEDGPVTARIVRWASFTPDGQVVFEALGKIWIAAAAGKPRRLTGEGHREYAPALSPDGKWVAFVSWDDRAGGHLWKAPVPDAAGGSAPVTPTQITRVARQYANPAWSADGSKIVLAWRPPNYGHTANVAEDDVAHEIVWVPSTGGDTRTVTSVRPRNAGRWFPVPQFSPDGLRVYFLAASSDTRNDLYSIALDGSDRRSHARFKYVEEAAPSPDGRRLAFVAMDDVYLAEMPVAGSEPVEIDLDRPAVPLKRVTREGGGYVRWNTRGDALEWCYAVVASRQPLGAARPEERRLEVTAPRGATAGSVLFTGARVLSMKDDRSAEVADVLVRDGRIASVGRSQSRGGDVRVVNVAGKFIIPGLVDAHYHGHYQGQEIFPGQKWQYLADLAYGVTTAREVSAPTRDTFAQADLVETGEMIGPRIYGTGWPLFAARDGGANHVVAINSLDDARQHVRRLKRSGATYLKQYLQPRREQRQWLAQAALEEGLMITAEGGGLKVQTTMMLDGFTGFEHGIPVAPIYTDLIQLMARTGTVYTPTFVAGYAKPGSMDYYYATEDPHEDRRAGRFIPHDLLDRFTSIRVLIPEAQYLYRAAARGAHEIRKAGGNVAVGGHGNHPGLGPHWELWSFVDGGMPPMEALRAATLGGAEMLGIQQDAGSLEAGKVADFVILNSDPRQNIRKTTDIHRVVKGGRVYDPDDLAQRVPWAAAPARTGTASARH